jgi:hypothetical protein
MSALTDLFTSMANKIRSKTGTATTYTPTEMVSDGIDDVYDAGYADATAPITPSNSSPASMTSGTGYKPTANGYAIQSYSNVTPSDASPVSMSSGDIVKLGSAGYAIASNPASLTPSDSSPAAISSGTIYKAGSAGYAVASQPASKTPSDTSPASVTSGSIVRPSASGYLYATNTNFRYGTVADKSTASEEFSINTGLSNISKFVMWGRNRNNDRTLVIIYDPNVIGSNKFSSAGIQTGAAAQRPTATIGDNSTAYNGSIKSISAGTVTIKQASSLDNIFASGIQWVAHS